MSKLTPRHLDHLVLPVPSLELARERYSALGFTVAPDARHKFGTENCMVYMANGTFIEPLAIGHRETVEANEVKGNTFLRRDMAYRFRNGDNGFSKLVFSGENAKEERKAFAKAGYDTGKLVTVKRPGLKVQLAFALDPRAPDMSLFCCERDGGKPPKPAKKLATHNNGAFRISSVVMSEPVPSDFQYYLQTVSGQRLTDSHSFGMDFELPNGELRVLNEDGLRGFYGIEGHSQGRGLRLVAFDVEVSSLKDVRSHLRSQDIAFGEVGPRVVVAPAQGQGAYLAFVEKG